MHKALSYGFISNETFFITQVALEQNVDAIFFITGYHRGFESIPRSRNEREATEWTRKTQERDYSRQLEKHTAEIPEMKQRIEKAMAKINADRAKKGQPPRILDQRWGVYSNADELGLKWNTPHPGHGPEYRIEGSEVSKYFNKLVDELYKKNNKPVPSINVILFLAGDEEFREEWDKQLEKYVRSFKGKKRVIRGGNEITTASSSKETTN